ncbi:Cu(I)-responsive transcriptional regulator [Vibrio sp. SCSIO 43136]|uniref:Cu(I)-responsive transcriptional regulator n=1 Tax=Vibrio sp. SCSIO 43136 TaxID=2819101 RepID=UPI002075C8DA|nr:Cu(I)-responsive transcriptional regulator [Vibrio sp. SCSIO 43136]USD64584.1 Cu(I)-responsive transcriptional regulator [Vibrio sp. SCSIO 43136]
MNISEVSKLTQLSNKSIRLYESKSLISEPVRAENGYRQYTSQHVEELRVIARARRVGFTLDECRSLVHLSQDHDRTSAEVKRKAEQKLVEVKAKIQELEVIKSQLEEWVSMCPGNSDSECPIIDSLCGKSGKS